MIKKSSQADKVTKQSIFTASVQEKSNKKHKYQIRGTA